MKNAREQQRKWCGSKMKTSNSVFQKVYGMPFAARQTSPAVVSGSDKLVSGRLRRGGSQEVRASVRAKD